MLQCASSQQSSTNGACPYIRAHHLHVIFALFTLCLGSNPILELYTPENLFDQHVKTALHHLDSTQSARPFTLLTLVNLAAISNAFPLLLKSAATVFIEKHSLASLLAVACLSEQAILRCR